MKTAGPRGQPYFLQGFLQVDDDLAAVFKRQRHHAAGALVVDIGIRLIVDPVAGYFHGLQNGFCTVQVFQVAHYNPIMFASLQIHAQILGRHALSFRPQGLGAAMVGVLFTACLVGCGQKGPLFLPGQPPPLQTLPYPQPTLPTSKPIPPAAFTPAPSIPDAPYRPAAVPQQAQ